MSTQLTIEEFCDKHNACDDGRDWAVKKCASMQEAWEKAKPEWPAWIACQHGILTDRELRLFAVFCARQVEHLMTDQRSTDAILVAERFANGLATDAELAAARDAAWGAAWDAQKNWLLKNTKPNFNKED